MLIPGQNGTASTSSVIQSNSIDSVRRQVYTVFTTWGPLKGPVEFGEDQTADSPQL